MKVYEVSETRQIEITRQVEAESDDEARQKFLEEQIIHDAGVREISNGRDLKVISLGEVKPIFKVGITRPRIELAIMAVEADGLDQAIEIARKRIADHVTLEYDKTHEVGSPEIRYVADVAGARLWGEGFADEEEIDVDEVLEDGE